MDATVLYLSKTTHLGEYTGIFVGDDLSAVVKDAINLYELDLKAEQVLEDVAEAEYSQGPYNYGSWSFEIGYLGDNSNLVLKMAAVDYTDDWRGEDGDY